MAYLHSLQQTNVDSLCAIELQITYLEDFMQTNDIDDSDSESQPEMISDNTSGSDDPDEPLELNKF